MRAERGVVKLKVLAIIIAAVVVMAGGFIAYKSIFSMSPKQMFLYAEAKGIKKFFEKKEEQSLGVQLANYLLDKSYRAKSELSMGFTAEQDGESVDEIEIISNILEGFIIEMDVMNDVEKNSQFTALNFKLQSTNLIDLNVINDKDMLAVQCPLLYDDYFMLRYEDIDKFSEEAGVPYNGPKGKYDWKQLKEAVKFDNQMLLKVTGDYSFFIVNFLKDDDFTLNKKASVEVADKMVKCHELVLELDEDRSKEFFKQFSERLANDDRLIEMVSDNISNVLKELDKAGISGMFENANVYDRLFGAYKGEPPTGKEIEDDAKKALKQLEELVGGLSFKDGLKITLYLDGKKNIIHQEVELAAEDSQNSGVKFEIGGTGYTNRDKTGENSMELAIEPYEKDSNGEDVIKLNYRKIDRPVGDSIESEIEGSLELNEGDSKEVDADLEMKVVSKNHKDNEESNYEFELNFGQESGENLSVKGKAGYFIKGTINKGELKSSLSIDADVCFEEELSKNEWGLKMEMDTEYDLKSAPDIPQVDSGNSINVAELDEQKKQKLTMEIVMKLQQFILKNKDILELMGVSGM